MEILFLTLNFFNIAFYESGMLPDAFAEYVINMIFIAFVANEIFNEGKKLRSKNGYSTTDG
jgi:hypothetical protein